MIVADKSTTLVLTGTGDVLEPENGIAAIGSGGNYALAAARALADTEHGRRGDRPPRHADRRRDLHLHQCQRHRGDARCRPLASPRCPTSRTSRQAPRREGHLLAARDRLRARPLHHRPERREARRRHRAPQPLAPPAAHRADARGGAAEEHPDDRPDRRRQDGDFAPPRQARQRALPQGRGDQVHRGRLCRPRRRADHPRPGRDRHRPGARGEAPRGAGARRICRPRSACSTRWSASTPARRRARASASGSAPASSTTRRSRSR